MKSFFFKKNTTMSLTFEIIMKQPKLDFFPRFQLIVQHILYQTELDLDAKVHRERVELRLASG